MMDKMQKLREFIKGHGLTGMLAFPVRSMLPSETILLYDENGIKIFASWYYEYIDIIGLSKDEFQSLADVLDIEEEAGPKCMDLPKVSIQGAGNAEGQEMSGTVYKVMEEIEYKFEIGAIIALLRKLLMATQDYNIAHPKHIGVQVENVLNFLIDAMVESLKKEKQEE